MKNKYPLINFKIKWPNDIYYKGKKLAGILIKTNIKKDLVSYIVFGIGINCISAPKILIIPQYLFLNFSDNKDPISLFIDLSKNITRSLKASKKFQFVNLDENLMNSFKDIGKKIKVKLHNEVIEGKLLKINEYGHLILENKKKIIKIDYGDIV